MYSYLETDTHLDEEYRKVFVKLRNEYKNILKYLRKNSDYIEIVYADHKTHRDYASNYDSEFVEIIEENTIGKKIVREWEGTITKDYNEKLTIKFTKKLYEYLNKQKFFYSRDGLDTVILDNSSVDTDIAFFNKKKECLLYVTTHERIIGLNEELNKILFGKNKRDGN